MPYSVFASLLCPCVYLTRARLPWQPRHLSPACVLSGVPNALGSLPGNSLTPWLSWTGAPCPSLLTFPICFQQPLSPLPAPARVSPPMQSMVLPLSLVSFLMKKVSIQVLQQPLLWQQWPSRHLHNRAAGNGSTDLVPHKAAGGTPGQGHIRQEEGCFLLISRRPWVGQAIPALCQPPLLRVLPVPQIPHS